MNWHEKLKAYKKETGHNNHDIAELTGYTYTYVRSILSPGCKRPFPRFMKILIKLHEQNKQNENTRNY